MVYHLRTRKICLTERLALVRRLALEHTHRILQTLITRWLATARQLYPQWQVIHITVCRRSGVGDGVGEAIIVRVVIGRRGCGVETGGVVEDVVGDEAVVGLAHEGVLAFVVLGACGGAAEGEGEGGNESGAGGEDYVARGVEGDGY